MDETISWIKEKEQLMASDDFGRDLASVQALLRKHEGLERDLAALEDKVRRLPDWTLAAVAKGPRFCCARSTRLAAMRGGCKRRTHRTPPRSC